MRNCVECQKVTGGLCFECRKPLCLDCARDHLNNHRKDLAAIVKKGQYNKKQARRIITDIMHRVRMSKTERTLMLIEILEKNKDGDFS